jgi:hypothetical protein
MKQLLKYKYTVALALIWIFCVFFFLFADGNPNLVPYQPTEELAKNLFNFSECSGGVIKYKEGYYCDAYAPTRTMWVVLIMGVVAFIGVWIMLAIESDRNSRHR